MRLEEAERKLRTAEVKIAEKDQRITEVERLLGCMGKVRAGVALVQGSRNDISSLTQAALSQVIF